MARSFSTEHGSVSDPVMQAFDKFEDCLSTTSGSTPSSPMLSPRSTGPSQSVSSSASMSLDSESDAEGFADPIGCSPSKCSNTLSMTTTPSFSPRTLSEASDSEHSSSSTESDEGKVRATPSLARASQATVYPIMLLLQIRAAMGGCAAPPPNARYSTCLRLDSEEHHKGERNQAPGRGSRRPNHPRAGNQHSGSAPKTEPASKGTLAYSESSWSAQQNLRRSQAGQGKSIESSSELTRKVRSVLNKLTPERFDSLYEQLASIEFGSPHHVVLLVREIFEKATVQHNFITMYADLCARLEADSRIVKAAGTKPGAQSERFRHILVNQCQAIFEEMLTGSGEWGAECQDSEEAMELRMRCKHRALGNVKFIGKLLVLKMLSAKLLASLCNDLIDSRGTCPDALECLAAMLTVTGPTFDTDENPLKAQFVEVLQQVQALVNSSEVQPRIKFLLRDVLEMRAAGWVDSKEISKQTKGPMKLQEVRCESAGTQHRSAATHPAPKEITPLRPKAAAAPSAAPAPGTVSTTASEKSSSDEGSVSGESSKKSKSAKKRSKAKSAADQPKPEQPTAAPAPFSRAMFHRELWTTLRELSRDGDVEKAVAKIEAQIVPVAQQAGEFADLLTRVVEEPDVNARQAYFALVARLAAGGSHAGAFSTKACLEGIENFFMEIFDDLCEEVDDLPTIVSTQLLPPLRAVTPWSELAPLVPPSMRN